jgi:hypothetical protein
MMAKVRRRRVSARKVIEQQSEPKVLILKMQGFGGW